MMNTRRPRPVASLLALALSAALLAPGCGREKTSENALASGAGGAGGAGASVAPTPAPFVVSRETPEYAARSIRELTLRGFDPDFLEPFVDPSQKWPEREGGPAVGGVPAFIGSALIYYSRLEMLIGAVRERFGEEAAERVSADANYFQLEVIGNGVREMFAASELKQLNQIGPMAYVAPLDENGEQLGYSLVFRENQGEWMWVMYEANTPWNNSRIGTLSGLVGKPLRDKGPVMAREMERIANGVRDKSIASVDEVLAQVRALASTQG